MDLLESLYAEHLEEISFSYDQWLGIMRDPRMNGFGFRDSEYRTEAHLDALIEDDLALSVCENRAVEGDEGECYGAARVFIRRSHYDVLERMIERMDGAETKRMKGLADALCHEMHGPGQEMTRWFQGDFFRELFYQDPGRVRMACQVAGFYRLDTSEDLFQALQNHSADHQLVLDIFHTLGRIRPRFGVERLLDFLENSDGRIVDGAISTLVRIGNPRLLKACMDTVSIHDWPALSLGLYGDREVLADVLSGMKGSLTPDHMIAAGLIGDLSFIPDLVNGLDDTVLAENAALALHLITGMEMYENHFIPDVTSENDLFSDEEKDAWRSGTFYKDGKISGRTVTRLSQNQDLWWGWFKKNQTAFDREKHYRLGKPCSPQCLLEQLQSETIPDYIRQLSSDELMIRYGLDLPFETMMTVSRQLQAIESHGRVIDSTRSVFTAGVLYYQGTPVHREKETVKS
jgi:hypothetical protein